MTKVKKLIEKAHTVVTELCNGKRRWTMHVPARPDEDPDLVISAALHAAECEIDRLKNLLGSEDERMNLLKKLQADHILEGTAIFKDAIDAEDKLDTRTIAEIKERFRVWHNTWIGPQAVKLLGEPIEEIEKLDTCEKEQ